MGAGPPGGASQARYIDREVNGSQRETISSMVLAVAREIVAKGRLRFYDIFIRRRREFLGGVPLVSKLRTGD